MRWLVRLAHDDHRELTVVREQVIIALARCRDRKCGHRCRVLPSDVLSRKTYSMPVIEHLVARYAAGADSLRQVAWSLLHGHLPQHTTLHGWTEGLGAHVLGRDAVAGEPHSAMVAEATCRWPAIGDQPPPRIDPRRFRSAPRHERLSAVAGLVQMASAIPGIDPLLPLADWRRRAIEQGVSSPLSFRSARLRTPIEQVDPAVLGSCCPCPNQDPKSPSHRTRSPPGDSNRSPPSSILPSTTPANDA